VLPWSVVVCYALLVAITCARHEPWADEAHSWLLGRDTSLIALWTRMAGLEGSPALWQSLLHVLNRVGLPYAGLSFVSGVLGMIAVWLLVFRSPLPLWTRLLLPFTFYLAYQYAVVARSYTLLPPPLFACAWLYRDVRHNVGRLTALLCLMAAVSVHGFVLSVAIWLGMLLTIDRRAAWKSCVVYVVLLAAIAWSAWPPSDGTFVTRADTSLPHLAEAAGRLLRGAFTGESWTSAIAIALSLPFLRRGGALPMFLLATVAMCGIAGLIYSQVWHQGLPLLAWLFAIWISTYRTHLDRAAAAALLLVMAPQLWWTASSMRYDWTSPYSGGAEAAQWIAGHRSESGRLFAIGYATTAVQPYFDRNAFANVNGGRPEAYWDWSQRNRTNLDYEKLGELRPDSVLVGYKNDFERRIWTQAITSSGYRLVRHFDGNTYWKTGVFEPDSFDLFRRGGAGR
jgi:hypothetical protein